MTCAAGYITVFLVALATDRAFLLHQPDNVRSRWVDMYYERHISWLSDPHMDVDAEKSRDNFVHLDLWLSSLI